jgi:uncharacterized protein (TIGR02246 family)
MHPTLFATPEDAESAFYEAFENADIEAMMAVWDNEGEIACIHPMGPRLTGYDEIRSTWKAVFRNSPVMRFELRQTQVFQDPTLSIHVVYEHIFVKGESEPRPPMIATNVYRLTSSGWRLILHHASPSPDGADMPTQRAAPSSALH